MSYELEPWAEDACDQIDAGIFSSDAFHSEEAIARLREFMARWERGLKEVEEIISGLEE
jgi:hypothetical protein